MSTTDFDPERHIGQQERRSRLAPEVEAIIADVIFRRPPWEKRTVDELRSEIALCIEYANQHRAGGQELRVPGRSTIARRVAALVLKERMPNRRSGVQTQDTTPHGQMERPATPVERVEIDHTPIPIIVIDGEDALQWRLTLTCTIDRRTRYPLGFYLGIDPDTRSQDGTDESDVR